MDNGGITERNICRSPDHDNYNWVKKAELIFTFHGHESAIGEVILIFISW